MNGKTEKAVNLCAISGKTEERLLISVLSVGRQRKGCEVVCLLPVRRQREDSELVCYERKDRKGCELVCYQ